MTARDRTEAGWIDDVLRWLHGLANQLAQSAADTRRITDRLGGCWMDDRGSEWVERAGLVQRQLDRDAQACAELARRVEHAAQEHAMAQAGEGRPVADPGDGRLSGVHSGAGPRLGSTAARRIDAARGMRIAMLSEEKGNAPGDR